MRPEPAGGGTVALVTPVFGNEATLADLVGRVAVALRPRPWSLRFVVDASPDASLAVARRLAAADPRLSVTALTANVGQHRALAQGLRDQASASAWVCLDADLQDPPEAVPRLLERLEEGDVAAVFGGRRGRYQGRLRTATGRLHRSVLSGLTGLPPGCGAFVALGPAARAAILELGGPSIVAAVGVAGLPVASVPVERARRPVGPSAWSARTRLRQSAATLVWAARTRAERARP